MIAETVGVFNRVSLMVAGDVVRFGDVKQRAKMITTHVRLLKARERERGVAVRSENVCPRLPGSRLESVVSVVTVTPPRRSETRRRCSICATFTGRAR